MGGRMSQPKATQRVAVSAQHTSMLGESSHRPEDRLDFQKIKRRFGNRGSRLPVELQPPRAVKKWSGKESRFVAALRTEHGAPGQHRITQNATSIKLRIARCVACGNFTDAVLDTLRLRLEHVSDDDIRWHGSIAELDSKGEAVTRFSDDAAFNTREASNGGEFVLEVADVPVRSFCIIDATPERVFNSIIDALEQAELTMRAEREAWTGGTDGGDVADKLAELFDCIRAEPPTLDDIVQGLADAQRTGELEVIGADSALLNVWQSMQAPGGLVRSAMQAIDDLRFGQDGSPVREAMPGHPADDVTKRASALSSPQRVERRMTRLEQQHSADQAKITELLTMIESNARRTVEQAHLIAQRTDLSSEEKFDELFSVFAGECSEDNETKAPELREVSR